MSEFYAAPELISRLIVTDDKEGPDSVFQKELPEVSRASELS